jgi:transposase
MESKKTVKIDGRTLTHEVNEHQRKLAVGRVLEGGEKPSEVMKSMGLCRTSIYKWLRKARKGGIEALEASVSKGPAPRLSAKQKQQIRRWIVGKDPRQYGFDFGLWTRRLVGALVEERFGIRLGLTCIGKVLAELDITPQKPLRRAYERDEAAVERWRREDYPRLKRRARRRRAEMFFCDEAGFSSEPNLGRTYGLRGCTPVVKTSGQRQKASAISMVNARGAFWYDVYTGNLNAGRFIGFLKKFMKGRRRNVFLVVDGHPSHRAKSVAEYVRSTRGRLEIHFLPPYAPDLNPDEFVWQYAKRQGASKRPLKRNESIKSRVEEDLEGIRKNKPLVRSFFRAKCVAYIND